MDRLLSTNADTKGDWLDYQGSVLAIDPSGRGSNETAYSVVKMLNGNLYLTNSGGLVGGYTDKTLQRLADIAKQEEVNLILIRKTMVVVCLQNY